MCHSDEEQTRPSRSTLIEFVLPLKIHFRYCWLFSGVPWRDSKYPRHRTELLSDQELLCCNRTLMTGDDPHLCGQVRSKHFAQTEDMKAFWLTTSGQLVYVDRLDEDIKLRYLRERNLRLALSLWTSSPELCSRYMKESDLAHGNLISICGEASRLSDGRFYNIYANYPLPINGEFNRQSPLDLPWVDENDVRSTVIENGEQLLFELSPLYETYFYFLANVSKSKRLSERVSILDAEWLVNEDRAELQFTQDVKRNLLTRMAVGCALF